MNLNRLGLTRDSALLWLTLLGGVVGVLVGHFELLHAAFPGLAPSWDARLELLSVVLTVVSAKLQTSPLRLSTTNEGRPSGQLPTLSIVLLAGALASAPVRAEAQPWGFDSTFVQLPQSAAIAAVKEALDQGLFGEPALAFIRARGVRAELAPAGAPWPCKDVGYRCVMLYFKGHATYDGNFQWVPDAGPDECYAQGWSISWGLPWGDPPTPPGFPVGDDGKHPTHWTLKPTAAPSGVCTGPVSTPPPAPNPPPVQLPPVQPPPANPPPAPVPSSDLAALRLQVDALAAQLAAAKTEIIAAVNEPGWFKEVFGNKYVQMALSGLGAYFATKAAQ